MTHKQVVTATINGELTAFLCEPHQSLLFCLREILGLTGAKEGCNDGNCGACSVILDGRLVNSCLVLGVEIEGRDVMTVEGLAGWDQLTPLQEAFIAQDALQCGYCTPGMLMAAKVLLDRNPDPTDEEIRAWLAGNLCRCTGYDKIIRAVRAAAPGAMAPEMATAPETAASQTAEAPQTAAAPQTAREMATVGQAKEA
jgi:aerobic carbon-monoxide dehydrogenase small subunit